MVATGTYPTIEKARNALDRPDWKEVERAKELAERARAHPGREVPEDLGRLPSRPSRQVNLKLSEPDFLSLKAVAVDLDIPVATAARVLLRRSLQEEVTRA
jgi:hypothetical protein